MSVTIDQLKSEIRAFVINQFLFGRGSVADDASFLEQGIVDSTGVLELVGHLESNYHLKVEDNELVPDNLDSVDNVAAFLARKLQSTDPSDGQVHLATP